MGKVIVTISRQYCSGGLKVGKILAEELGISCYDSEMFRIVSTPSGLDQEKASTDGGTVGSSLVEVADSHRSDIPDYSDELVSLRNLYDYQSDLIRELAEKESCVIVGRCSNYILKDRTDTLSVFVHAPLDFRAGRAMTIHNMEEEELKRYILQMDQKKADYYHEYTGEDWQDAAGYELSLDSSRYGLRGCVDRIRRYLQA